MFQDGSIIYIEALSIEIQDNLPLLLLLSSNVLIYNKFFSQIMIKQSFLRNYNLSKILCQAQDQKKRLQIFYYREVEKIIRQRRQNDREQSRQIACKQHREQRLRLKEKIKEMKENRLSQDRQTLRRTKTFRKNTERDQQNQIQEKKKTDLFVTDLQLKSSFSRQDSNHQSLKITTVPNRNFHQKMLQLVKSKLKQQHAFQMQFRTKKQNNIEHFNKNKFNTNPSFYDNSEKNIFDTENATNQRYPIKMNRYRLKRNQTSKILVKRNLTYNQMSTGLFKNAKFNVNFINQLQSNGNIKQQTEGASK